MKTTAAWRSLHGLIVGVLVITALALLLIEHLEHLRPYLPFAIILLCPLLHLFMHRGHHTGHQPEQEHLDEAYRRGLADGRKKDNTDEPKRP